MAQIAGSKLHTSKLGLTRAFTLLELSIVVLILGLLAAAVMRYANSVSDSNYVAATNAAFDAIDTAMLNYRNEYGRLPCPARLSASENTTAFGSEVYTNNAGDGTCNDSANSYNLVNTGTDPDASGGSDPGAPDPLYDSATSGNVVQGGVPTKTLKIADKYAYDGWGRKIFYAVDRRGTTLGAFTAYPVSNTFIGAVVVKKTATDTLANAMTYKGMYAIISMGKTGHGAYARAISGTAVTVNSSQTAADVLKNCHCSTADAATTYDRIYVQKPRINDSTTTTGNFDNIVRFKTRTDMANSTEMQ